MTFEETVEKYGWGGVVEVILRAVGRSGAQLARLMNVTPVTVSRWRNNHCEPRGKYRDQLETLFIKFVQ